MNSVIRELSLRKQRLERAIRSAEDFLKEAPEGRLRISNRCSGIRYYRVNQKLETTGIYIPKKDKELASLLAQKDYAQRFLLVARKELSSITRCLHSLNCHDAESVFSSLNLLRQDLVSPYMTNNEKCAEKWNSIIFQSSTYEPQEKRFKTRNGEMVRSKSELIIADIYFELGIPYRYECEITLRNGSRKYPDFTLFHAPRRVTIYHEHLGLMDDENYVNKNLSKIRDYGENGIYVGNNLLLTFETRKEPFDPSMFRKQVKEIFWLK